MYQTIARPIVIMVLTMLTGKAEPDRVKEILDAIPVGTAIGAIGAVIVAIISTQEE